MADNHNTAEPQKPRGRWFQFRLRTMLVAVVVIGSICGWAAKEARIVHDRDAVIRRIGRMHGMVRLAGDQTIDHQSTLQVPWLRRLMGDFDVVEIDVPVEAISQMNVAELRQLKDEFPEAAFRAVRWPAREVFINGSGRGPKPEDYPQYFPFPDTDPK